MRMVRGASSEAARRVPILTPGGVPRWMSVYKFLFCKEGLGRVEREGGGGGFQDILVRVSSSLRAETSTAVMIEVALALEEPVGQYLPEVYIRWVEPQV